MWPPRINTTTACFAENREAGLMVCGINWGGSPDEPSSGETASFFSDCSVNNYPYRNRLLTWFELFGHPLETKSNQAGSFEKSIIQTNWLSNQSPNMNGKAIYAECIKEWGNFQYHLQELNPKIIIFLSVTLLEALNSLSHANIVHSLLGAAEKPKYYKKSVQSNGVQLKRFRVGAQKFKNAHIIALPHPTGSVGLSNDYIQAFKPEIFPIFEAYKYERKFTA
jgi:hypothetical protein